MIGLEKGKVYLVGAGPGDFELLTIKALNLLKKADVIVHDRLIDKKILGLISKNTEKIDVGKNSGNHPIPQDEINKILVAKAFENKVVVRFKGGDPFLFGRGGEEILHLIDNGIDFEVVPGVTSAISSAAYGGIPVTHRNYASSLHIFTGHSKKNTIPEMDYESISKIGGTLVFLMSLGTIGIISENLIKNGMDKNKPAAIIENGTLERQRKFLTTLSEIKNVIIENEIQSPAIIIIGDVCSLSDKLDWFSKLPLKNIKVLVTRPKETSGKLSSLLKEKGADVTIFPCIKTEPIEFSFDIEKLDWLVFTSAAGVRYFFSKLHSLSKDTRIFSGKKFGCVGSETAKELLNKGIISDYTPNIYDGKHLAEGLISLESFNKSETIGFLRAQNASEEILNVFRKNEINFIDIPIYKTIRKPETEFIPDNYDYVTFTSKSCVEGFVESGVKTEGINALCIGSETASFAKKYNMNTITSDKATITAMVEKLITISNHS